MNSAPTLSATGASSVVPRALRTVTSDTSVLDNWLVIQSLNLERHAKSLRPFTKDEFGRGPAAPSEAHIQAANRFIDRFRARLENSLQFVEAAIHMARREPTAARLRVALERKQLVGARVLYAEGIWDFFFDLFVQRLSKFGERLRAVDRIGANCYEDLYVGMGNAQPTPRLLPFSYAQSGFSPATFRRGVPITRLRRNPNPFPLIMLPQHRLENVWALSSVLHEVSHNLQADLGLWEKLPRLLFSRLTGEGKLSAVTAAIWARWHKEMMADMFALVLGGPAAVESLMDVVGRAPASTVRFSPVGVHPTPYLRVLINLAALRRLGLARFAGSLGRVWRRLYPHVTPADIPPAVMETFDRACELAVDTMVFQAHPEFANKSLAQIIPFGIEQMRMIAKAGSALATGSDPGSIPARYMIGAARYGIDKRLGTPQAITENFFATLGRR